MKEIELERVRLPGLNEGTFVDFSDVTTVEQLKDKVIYHYVSICRKCGYEDYCHFVPPQETTCPLVAQAVSNFIDTTAPSVDLRSRERGHKYAQLLVAYVELNTTFVNWLGGNLDRDIITWLGGRFPWFNHFWASRLQEQLTRFLKNFTIFDFHRKKQAIILVEGNSEEVALQILLKREFLTADDIEVQIQNLGGKDKATPAALETTLNVCRKQNTSCFLILDNEGRVSSRVRKMVENGTIGSSHVRIWDKTFEDTFTSDQLLAALHDMRSHDLKGLKRADVELARAHSRGVMAGLDKLLFERGRKVKASTHKKEIARALAENLVGQSFPNPLYALPGREEGPAEKHPLVQTLRSFLRIMGTEYSTEQIRSDHLTQILQRPKLPDRKTGYETIRDPGD
jgi:hypothetical protein